jgi:glycosyltransferase involved in cell wall biosynthesis
MRRLFEALTWQKIRRFSVGSLTVIGRPLAKRQKNRALLFADSYGPTVQINFVRPLTHSAPEDRWGIWTITESSHGELDDESSLRMAERDLDLILSTYRPDVIVASRYAGALAPSIIAAATNRKIPLIVHLDDNLFEVPVTTTAVPSRHTSSQRRERLAALLAAADLDLVSTAALQRILEKLGVLGPYILVAKLAGAAPILGQLKRPSRGEIVFGYMGTRSHMADLAMVSPAIAQLLEQHSNLRFELFGSIEVPQSLSRFNVQHHEKIRDYEGFLRKLASLHWAFALAPLETTPFNLAKTNIKWIEYTSAGIPVVASDHPVYQDCCAGGAGLLAGPDDWYAAMQGLMGSQELRETLHASARAKLVDQYSLGRLRLQVLEAFVAAGVSL